VYLSILKLEMTVFLDITPYILVEVERSFRAAYCMHKQGNETYRPNNGGQKCAVVKLFGQFCACEISGSHGGDYKADSLLGYFKVQSGCSIPTFQYLLPPSWL
jgi:hypothetical protein